jgi:serine/threonine-protein kinase
MTCASRSHRLHGSSYWWGCVIDGEKDKGKKFGPQKRWAPTDLRSGAKPAAPRRLPLPPPIPDAAKPRAAKGSTEVADVGVLPGDSDVAIDLVESDSIGPGDVIDGKYEVVRVLGVGGMGLVLQATHLGLREPVALKFMNAATVANPEASARFIREARAAARLKGEHICRVLDMGETVHGDRYIVIEYLEGADLAQVLNQRGPLPWAEVVDYILQACEAMAEAHAANIVHRDLKPANLFLTTGTDGAAKIKVLDFGISKLLDSAQASVTSVNSLMGSPLYMAPEQLVNATNVDPRADIWALASVVYRLVSGRTPFAAGTLPEIVAQVLHKDPPTLSSRVVDVPEALDRTLLKALAKDRADRYETVADFAADLAAVVPGGAQRAARSAAVLRRRPTTGSEGLLTPPAGTIPPVSSTPASPVTISTLWTSSPGEGSESIAASFAAAAERDKHVQRASKSRWWRVVIPAIAICGAVGYVVFDKVGKQAAAPGDGEATPVVVDPEPPPQPAVTAMQPDAAAEPEPEADETEKPRASKKPRAKKPRARAQKPRVKKSAPEKSEPDSGSGDLLEPELAPPKKPKKTTKPKKQTIELLD